MPALVNDSMNRYGSRVHFIQDAPGMYADFAYVCLPDLWHFSANSGRRRKQFHFLQHVSDHLIRVVL